jgi:hypothetical protein
MCGEDVHLVENPQSTTAPSPHLESHCARRSLEHPVVRDADAVHESGAVGERVATCWPVAYVDYLLAQGALVGLHARVQRLEELPHHLAIRRGALPRRNQGVATRRLPCWWTGDWRVPSHYEPHQAEAAQTKQKSARFQSQPARKEALQHQHVPDLCVVSVECLRACEPTFVTLVQLEWTPRWEVKRTNPDERRNAAHPTRIGTVPGVGGPITHTAAVVTASG